MEFSEYLRFLIALCFVLSLIGGLALLARKLGWTQGQFGYVKPDARLRVVESLSLDTRRRAVIIRRDNVEHLLVLGATSETLIETDIRALTNEPTCRPDRTADETGGDLKSKIVSGVFGHAGGVES